MASEITTFSQSSTLIDEFGGIEITEFDPNALRELLYEPSGKEEEEEKESGEAVMQSMEVPGTDSELVVDSYWCLDDINEEVRDFNWVDMVEEISAPWYGSTYMEEMNEIFEMEDYTLSQSEILTDEIGYIGLWQEN
ncbi:hypothetical protein BUALT_Bualt03G0225000 [Buddleja alternifolia]|uniref:Uncharacterized protein n=1 Tax=Buddleja alternifolia TaxID=168488 RepID=A0AAV6Y4H2_9LAMI|nr:hypothetical protein BUALT_Bualt03G0225000 [Buddleja alternifolia]